MCKARFAWRLSVFVSILFIGHGHLVVAQSAKSGAGRDGKKVDPLYDMILKDIEKLPNMDPVFPEQVNSQAIIQQPAKVKSKGSSDEPVLMEQIFELVMIALVLILGYGFWCKLTGNMKDSSSSKSKTLQKSKVDYSDNNMDEGDSSPDVMVYDHNKSMEENMKDIEKFAQNKGPSDPFV